MRLPLYIVAPEIVDLFGGEGGTSTLLSELFTAYDCVVCDKTVQLDTDHPATVVVIIHDGGAGPLWIRLAHPACSPSRVAIVPHAPDATGYMRVPAMAWLREGNPAAVLVIAPRVRARRLAGGNDLLDMLISGLLASGFALLTSPDMPLPVLAGRLLVKFGPGQRIRVVDEAGNAFYDGSVPVLDGWAELAELTGLLGIVVVAGIDLEDTDRDRLAALFAAIRDGIAVGAAVGIGDGQQPEHHQPGQWAALPASGRELLSGTQPD